MYINLIKFNKFYDYFIIYTLLIFFLFLHIHFFKFLYSWIYIFFLINIFLFVLIKKYFSFSAVNKRLFIETHDLIYLKKYKIYLKNKNEKKKFFFYSFYFSFITAFIFLIYLYIFLYYSITSDYIISANFKFADKLRAFSFLWFQDEEFEEMQDYYRSIFHFVKYDSLNKLYYHYKHLYLFDLKNVKDIQSFNFSNWYDIKYYFMDSYCDEARLLAPLGGTKKLANIRHLMKIFFIDKSIYTIFYTNTWAYYNEPIDTGLISSVYLITNKGYYEMLDLFNFINFIWFWTMSDYNYNNYMEYHSTYFRNNFYSDNHWINKTLEQFLLEFYINIWNDNLLIEKYDLDLLNADLVDADEGDALIYDAIFNEFFIFNCYQDLSYIDNLDELWNDEVFKRDKDYKYKFLERGLALDIRDIVIYDEAFIDDVYVIHKKFPDAWRYTADLRYDDVTELYNRYDEMYMEKAPFAENIIKHIEIKELFLTMEKRYPNMGFCSLLEVFKDQEFNEFINDMRTEAINLGVLDKKYMDFMDAQEKKAIYEKSKKEIVKLTNEIIKWD